MAKPKIRKEYNETTNRSVYNKARKRILASERKIHCGSCSYHRKCNDKNYYYAFTVEPVENKRANKFFNRKPNWKLVTKNSKQWMPKFYKTERKVSNYYGFSYYEIVI